MTPPPHLSIFLVSSGPFISLTIHRLIVRAEQAITQRVSG